HYGPALRDGLVLVAGLTVGLAGLVYFDRWIAKRRAGTGPVVAAVAPETPPGGPATRSTGGVATQVVPAPAATGTAATWRSPAGQLALLIATGIGLHNFAEGLAIGNSAASGELALAVLLVIGFGLHNATEGFGIVAPLAASGERPSWSSLLLLGLIGGGPTFLGTLVGQHLVNDTLSI